MHILDFIFFTAFVENEKERNWEVLNSDVVADAQHFVLWPQLSPEGP